MLDTYPFETLSAAIAFYRFKNPARQKQTNIYEPDRIPIPNPDTESPRDLWAAVALAIAKVLRKKPYAEYWSFCYWHIVLRDTDQGIDFIAKELQITPYQVRKHINTIEDEIAKELIRRDLLDPKYEDNAAYARIKAAHMEN